MKKTERITELEAEVVDLRLLIAKLATRIGYLELGNQKQDIKPIFIPQWNPDPLPCKVTCTTKADHSLIPQNSEPIMKLNPAVAWPSPTSPHSSSSPK